MTALVPKRQPNQRRDNPATKHTRDWKSWVHTPVPDALCKETLGVTGVFRYEIKRGISRGTQ
jgi:hypothetical protein